MDVFLIITVRDQLTFRRSQTRSNVVVPAAPIHAISQEISEDGPFYLLWFHQPQSLCGGCCGVIASGVLSTAVDGV